MSRLTNRKELRRASTRRLASAKDRSRADLAYLFDLADFLSRIGLDGRSARVREIAERLR